MGRQAREEAEERERRLREEAEERVREAEERVREAEEREHRLLALLEQHNIHYSSR
jgi:hypothetical protein